MSIFDIFTFKKEIAKAFSKENISNLFSTARSAIIEQIKNNIPGEDKKKQVDEFIIAKIKELVKNCNNKLVLWVVDKIIDLVPVITQFIYNFLKEKVENL